MIGTGMALLIGGLASTGINAVTARNQSKAVKEAAATQTAAVDKAAEIEAEANRQALAFEQEQFAYQKAQYEERKAAMAPYASMGTAAMSELSNRMGIRAAPAAPVSMPMMTAPMPTAAPPPAFGPAADEPRLSPVQRFAANRQAAPLSPAQRARTGGVPMSSMLPPAGGGAPQAWQGVTMMAPNGSIKVVPREQVPHWTAQGGRIVGAA